MWGKQPFKALKLCTKTSVQVSRSLQPRAQSWRLKNPSELWYSFSQTSPMMEHRGLSLNTNCNIFSSPHVLRALYLILPAVFPIKSIMMSQQESFEIFGYLRLERQGPTHMLDKKTHTTAFKWTF